MLKYFFIFLLSVNLLFGQDSETTKPSELELFLFKIGFESLLKDVDINKQKSELNKEDIKELKEKVQLIFTELYKKETALSETKEEKTISSNAQPEVKEDIESLKTQIVLLKEEINKLKSRPSKELVKKEPKKIDITEKKSHKMIVIGNDINIYKNAYPNSKVVGNLKKDDIVYIEFCDSFGWCKIEDENKYIKRFLIKNK